MKKMTKKYQRGGDTVTDPEGNKITTKTRGRKTITKVKYSDPESAGRKRERTVTKAPTKTQQAVASKYSKEIKDLGYKKGGAVSKKKLPTAKYGRGVVSTSDGTYTRAGKKIGSGIGKSAEYRDFTTGTGDRSTKSISEKVQLRKSNKKASDSGNIQIAKKGGAVHKMPNGKIMKGRTHKKK